MDDAIESLRAREFYATLDEEITRLLEVKRLQGSVLAYRGHLTRAYNVLRLLCSNSGSLSEIMSKKSALDDLFARYTAVIGSLLQSLVDLEE